jgi:hypothetical protein
VRVGTSYSGAVIAKFTRDIRMNEKTFIVENTFREIWTL